ncbi:MAG: Flp pilus assembly protein CpaB [Cystobacterineae bacterium]|nr:Flp pilus assembly protein CpaB [Cystobacterineae bacterium]
MLKGKMPLVLAFALAAFAGILAFTAIKSQALEVKRGWNLKTVIVANVDIPEGTDVTRDMLALYEVPERFVTTSNIGAGSVDAIQNQKILANVQKGDPILWSQFSMAKPLEQLSRKVLKRMRAFTLKVNNTSSVGGWVRPNDRVDIIGIFRDSQSQENISMTLMQGVVVLATGTITGTTNAALISEGDRKYSEVSLLVLPEDVEQLALAQELGSLTLSLRNEEDTDVSSDMRKTTIRTLTDPEMQKSLGRRRERMIEVIQSGVAR